LITLIIVLDIIFTSSINDKFTAYQNALTGTDGRIPALEETIATLAPKVGELYQSQPKYIQCNRQTTTIFSDGIFTQRTHYCTTICTQQHYRNYTIWLSNCHIYYIDN
jgi:hypothetical protein